MQIQEKGLSFGLEKPDDLFFILLITEGLFKKEIIPKWTVTNNALSASDYV